jgi:hypothetical protein
MAEFHAEVFQNEFLPDGGTDVHAIVTVSCVGAGEAGRAGSGDAAEVIIVDCSTSMARTKIAAARQAAAVAIDQIIDGTWFAVVAGTDTAYLAYPDPRSRMVRMDDRTRTEAKQAVSRLQANGGTAIGRWLRLTRDLFDAIPSAAQRHAILLTDGQDQGETPRELRESIAYARGAFQCDCRGVGADWHVAELRSIATELLGTVDLVAEPAGLEADFEAIMRAAMGRGVADAVLRVWAPQGSDVLFVRQVAPTLEDLTSRRQVFNPLTGDYPTGSWGDESRDYHVSVRVGAKAVGAEQLAARVQLVVGGEVVSSGLVKAKWSSDDALTTRIDPAVAHYTGQAELADAIQEGLAARASGDTATATTKLGRAVQLAAESGNDEATTRLRKVVDIEDPGTGTVRLKRNVDKLDEMALDTASTKTTRINK